MWFTAGMWDERYAREGFVYGTAPNDFVAASVGALKSPVICLASGEGRNPVWLAEQGFAVTAVDGSQVGVDKTLKLAAERGVAVDAVQADLADFDIGEACWGGAVITFGHLPPALRAKVHAGVVRGLRPGGALVMEVYTPRQLGRGTGGPPVEHMLYEPDDIRRELRGLSFERCAEIERPVVEGWAHTGTAAVLQIVGIKPG